MKLAWRVRGGLPGRRGAEHGHKPRTTETYLRMTATLLPDMIDKLEDADAPTHVYRFIAYGSSVAERCIRCALALYLRRPVAPGRPSRSLTGMVWIKDAQQRIACDVFMATPEGPATVAWIRANMFAMARGGSFDPKFWREIERRVRTILLEEFWREIDARVAVKPKRAVQRGSRAARPPRPQALSVQERRELRVVVAQLVLDRGLRDEVAAIVRARGMKETKRK